VSAVSEAVSALSPVAPLYRLAIKTFGQHGTIELICLVGLYCLVSTTLNAYNVPVPERE
jgi:4-carboxymuconolactone decarboxylase